MVLQVYLSNGIALIWYKRYLIRHVQHDENRILQRSLIAIHLAPKALTWLTNLQTIQSLQLNQLNDKRR